MGTLAIGTKDSGDKGSSEPLVAAPDSFPDMAAPDVACHMDFRTEMPRAISPWMPKQNSSVIVLP
jgi:hypothetical protein